MLVWGRVAANGVGNLAFSDRTMTTNGYTDILYHNLTASAQKLHIEESLVSQRDNDPKLTAYVTKECLMYNAPRRLLTPAQSPDLNPIENLWNALDERIQKHPKSNVVCLKEALQKKRTEISPEVTRRSYVLCMPCRLQAVTDTHGIHTKY